MSRLNASERRDIYSRENILYNESTMALYHTYRPQTFRDVVDQEHIVQTITNQILRDSVSHAYLFSGPRGVGKTSLARLLAKAVNCTNRSVSDPNPCTTCASCIEIQRARAIDVVEIDAASHTGVDNVREQIIEHAQFQPTKNRYKIYIIDEAHMLSTNAFNALLKILEEPPTHILFIFATTERHKIPATILSRCQRFDFHRLSANTMKHALLAIAKKEDVTIDSVVLDRIIGKSDGCMRDALSFLDQLMSAGEKHITAETASLLLPTTAIDESVRLFLCFVEKNIEKGLEVINEFATTNTDLVHIMDDLISLSRTVLLLSIQSARNDLVADLSDETLKTLKNIEKNIAPNNLVTLIDILSERRNHIRTSPLPQLPIELALVEWSTPPPQTHPLTPPPSPQKKTEKIIEENKEAFSASSAKKPLIHVEDVKNVWSALLENIEKKHPSLCSILHMADVTGVHEDNVELHLAYPFHRDSVMEKTRRSTIESILSSLLGTPLRLTAVVLETPSIPNQEAMTELATALGGDVVQ